MKKFLAAFFLFAFITLIPSKRMEAQTFTIGADNGTNGAMAYPTPFGDYYKTMRAQFLYRASELTDMGMTAGFISELGWNVAILPPTTGETENYTIKLLSTPVASLGVTTWEAGATVVYGPVTYTPVLGLNNFTLDVPFFWDGSSNIIVEVCGGVPAGTFTKCARVTWTGPLAFNGSHTFRSDTENNVCDYAGVDYFDDTPGGPDYRPQIQFTTMPATNCATLGAIGAATSTAASVCLGETFTLSVTPIVELGITYQWSRSVDGVSFSNIPGASTSSYITTQTSAFYYRCKVTCTFSGDQAFSTAVLVGQNLPTECYCIPNYDTGTTEGDYVGNVHLGTINNTTGGAAAAPFYTFYPAFTTDLHPGASYSISITCGSYATSNGVAAWIDYNQDGVFNEATEKLGEVTGLTAFSVGTINFTVPPTALLGTARLRVRDVWNQLGMTACTTYGFGETEDYNVNMTPGVPPVANFTYSGDPLVAFTDISTESPTSWSWTFGDGGTSIAHNPVHTYLTNGTYNVCLTATNIYGSNTFCQNVVIDSYTPPVPEFSFTGDPTVSFTDLSTMSPTSWSWTFGDGGTSTLENPVHTYALNGVYSVCLVATNALGSNIICHNVTIDSYLAPVSSFAFSGDPTVTFTDFSTNSPTSWFWYFGDGATSTLQNPVHTYAANGIYNVCLTATNATGSNTSCQNVTIDSYLSPLADFSWTGDPVTSFTDLSLNSPTSWSWDFGDGGTSSLENPTHTFATNGTFNVCLTATNAAGSNTSCDNVIIDSYAVTPVAEFTYSGDPVTAFTDISSNTPTSWSWDFGDGGTSTLQNPVHNFAINGTYSVCLTASNVAGSDAACHTIIIGGHPAPEALFVHTGDPVVAFTDLSTNSPFSWLWTFDDGSISTLENPTHTYATNGTFNVCLTVTGPGGVDNYCEDVVIANNGFPPVAAFSWDATGLTVTFTDESTNSPNDWFWDFGDGAISGLQNPTHAYAVTGEYNVCLTALNDIGNDNTCETILVTLVGINDPDTYTINLYPNPATTQTTVIAPQLNTANATIRLFDLEGREIETTEMITINSNNSITIHTNSLAAGTYLLKVNDNSGTYTGKLVKL